MKKSLTLLILFVVTVSILPQHKDKAAFIEPKSEFWEQITKDVNEFNAKTEAPKKVFKVDFSNLDLPKSKSDFTSFWHNDPVSQGVTGTCWSFSTTSFYESEIYRLTKQKVKLSEMYTAYWEYVEKAKGFVQSRGTTVFGEGSEANALKRIWKKYGIVPLEAYTGKLPGQKTHDHSVMYKEMNDYLSSVKQMNMWNEDLVVSTIRAILDKYMGRVPDNFKVGNETYTPLSYLEKVVRINLDDYYELMSLMQSPYYTYAEYNVPDNWWHSAEYLNVPLDKFMDAIKKSIRSGYTVCIGGDVSEPGIESHYKVAMVPTFDIPSEYIDENARQFRFTNKTSEDDHGIHLVGYMTKDGKDWFLIKDSGSGSFNIGDKGYYFYSEDYVKLKMLGCTIHKDMIQDLLKQVK